MSLVILQTYVKLWLTLPPKTVGGRRPLQSVAR